MIRKEPGEGGSSISEKPFSSREKGSVAKNILTTFYSRNELFLATISCVASGFLQQSLTSYADNSAVWYQTLVSILTSKA